jgi:hypothetical protein
MEAAMSALIAEALEMLELEYEDPNDDAKALADVAVRLAKVINDHQAVLDKIKPVLRDAARGVSGTEHFHWKTDAGSTSVTFPEPRWKARKGTDWDRVKRDLGDAFDVFFDTRVSYGVRKDIATKVKRRMASESDLVSKVMSVIEREEPTPRVGFKPR